MSIVIQLGYRIINDKHTKLLIFINYSNEKMHLLYSVLTTLTKNACQFFLGGEIYGTMYREQRCHCLQL